MLSKTLRRQLAAIPLCLFLLAGPAVAHPGHANLVAPADSPMHYVLQPSHAAGWLVLAVATIYVVWLSKYSAKDRRLAWSRAPRSTTTQGR
ncbi:MAG TPA: hypothetical protein DDW52_25495 [Planctomycetaceae bacterium]|nr:hypothetical protein [Planctomycetaceae bacterium]